MSTLTFPTPPSTNLPITPGIEGGGGGGGISQGAADARYLRRSQGLSDLADPDNGFWALQNAVPQAISANVGTLQSSGNPRVAFTGDGTLMEVTVADTVVVNGYGQFEVWESIEGQDPHRVFGEVASDWNKVKVWTIDGALYAVFGEGEFD